MSPFGELGVGVGLRPPHYAEFKNQKPKSISWVEVISENFMAWQNREIGEAHQILLQIRKDLPVMLHGVSLSVGSADDLNLDYLKRLKILIDIVQPHIISDHLCWTGVDGKNVHDLLPVPYTEEALGLISQKIDAVQNILGRKILIENASSYLEFQSSEMTEWEFITQLTEKADCGILLDINNVYVSSVNHGFDPKKYLKNIPIHRIGQIHLAGHSKMDGYLIDTHDEPVCEEVWDLFRWFTREYGNFSTMIERDGNIPKWNELEQELLKIGEIRNEKILYSL
jgi:uncharacterized protein (UPF0276 family)